MTAFWYSGGSSRWVSAAARISSAETDEIATVQIYLIARAPHTGENPRLTVIVWVRRPGHSFGRSRDTPGAVLVTADPSLYAASRERALPAFFAPA